MDLLVHETLDPQLVGLLNQGAGRAGHPRLVKITDDILDYHTTPVEAAEDARDATHFLVPHDSAHIVSQ